MTNEQAIEVLSEIRCGYNCFDEAERPFYHALSMAIETLQARASRNSVHPSCSEKPNRSEPLTDKEQRIFLAAMERERKVCKQVDKEWRDCREPYEDSLVMICNEIERKVKGALWET